MMKFTCITNTETPALSISLPKALTESENPEMLLIVNGSELMDQIMPILLHEGLSSIETNSQQSDFKGGRRSRVSESKTAVETLLSSRKFQAPKINLTAAVIGGNFSFDNMSQLPAFKKQIIEPLLPLLSPVSRVVVVCPSQSMAVGTILILSLTHPLTQYTAELASPLSFQLSQESEFEVIFSESTVSVPSYLTGQPLEDKIQEMLTLFPIRAAFSETSSLFLRKIVFAIVKERDHKRSIQSFQRNIITQLTDPTNSNGDSFDRKRKHEQVSKPDEIENTRKIGKTRSVKSLPSAEEGLSVFEFFSGIGGMRLALPKVIRGIPIRKITAFDINRIANQFYEYNFHERKIDDIKNSQLKTCVIEALKAEDVDGKCDIWTMSPPCQPFTTTRGANRKDHLDNRSKGLYHIMSLLLTIEKLPRWIVLENVKGFVNSEMYSLWLQVMQSCGYEYEEYLLSPETAVGIPNARKRYYFIAELKDTINIDPSENQSSQLLDQLDQGEERKEEGSRMHDIEQEEEEEESEESNGLKDEDQRNETNERELKAEVTPVDPSSSVFLNENVKTQLPIDVQRIYSVSKTSEAISLREMFQRRVNEKDWSHFNEMSELIVPLHILQSSWAKKHLSVVDFDSQLTYCFTKGYGKIYDHSAGSCLFIPSLTSTNSANEVDREQLINYYKMIRLFHPEELLVLFGFPNDYCFPPVTPSLTLSHQYGCIGNSVNVTVVKTVMHRLFQ